MAEFSRAQTADVNPADRYIKILRDASATETAKGDACQQLMALGPKAKPAVPALRELLKSEREILRDYAITTLTIIGPEASAALPALAEIAARDPSSDLRQLATEAIRIIRGSGAKTDEPPVSPGNEPASRPAATANPLSPDGAKPAAAIPPKRPPLEIHQGRFFSWAAPQGWHFSETMSGVSLYSGNEDEYASFALLMRSRGQITPREFLLSMMRRIPGNSDVQITTVKSQPNQPSGIPGTVWKVEEIELNYTVKGKAVTGLWTCGINAYYGMYDAMIAGYHATKAAWPFSRQYLPEMSRSIRITNPRQVAGNDQLIPAKNNPLDNSGLIESWRQKGLSEDRISKVRREGTSGYERVKDAVTGQIYEMPLEAYDGTLGGYRNPVRPGEALSTTQPWE